MKNLNLQIWILFFKVVNMNYRDLINIENPMFNPLARIDMGKKSVYIYKVYQEKNLLKAICSNGLNGTKKIQEILTVDDIDYLLVSKVNDTSTYIALKDAHWIFEEKEYVNDDEYQI